MSNKQYTVPPEVKGLADSINNRVLPTLDKHEDALRLHDEFLFGDKADMNDQGIKGDIIAMRKFTRAVNFLSMALAVDIILNVVTNLYPLLQGGG